MWLKSPGAVLLACFARLAYRTGGIVFTFLAATALAFSQGSQTPQASPGHSVQAVALISQSLNAISGSVPLTDITLQGAVTLTAGADTETGSISLQATSRDESRVMLDLSTGQRQQIRFGQQGIWEGSDGQAHAMALHNCLTDAAWFFPALTLKAALANPSIGITYVGPETLEGEPVQHIELVSFPAGQSPATTSQIEQLSAMNVYLDASSGQPVALDFNLHPDDDAGVNIPVEIRYSGYAVMNGVRVPAQIQEYIENTLTLDIEVSSATVNSGLTDGVFALPPVSQSTAASP